MNPKNVFVNDKPLFEVVRSVAIRKGLSKEVKNYLDQNAYLLTGMFLCARGELGGEHWLFPVDSHSKF